MFESTCPTCHRTRVYKSKSNRDKLIDKNCRSCANSISGGGTGYRAACKCGKPKYKGSSTWCRECHVALSKKYHKEIYRYRKYGITKEWFDMQKELGCAICKTQFSSAKNTHVDHSHSTGVIRGLLCGTCNKGLGQFMDSAELLTSAAEYLKRFV